MTVTRFLLYMLRIRRVEFRVAEIPILAIPVLLLIRDSAPLKTFAFWEGIFIFFLLFAFGDMISGLYAALSVLMALDRRDGDGKGEAIDLSCCEAPLPPSPVSVWKKTARRATHEAKRSGSTRRTR